MIKLLGVFALSLSIVGCNSISYSNKNANIHVNQYGINANINANIEF